MPLLLSSVMRCPMTRAPFIHLTVHAIVDFLKKVTTITKVHYWSDGLSSQFKNKYNLRASKLTRQGKL